MALQSAARSSGAAQLLFCGAPCWGRVPHWHKVPAACPSRAGCSSSLCPSSKP